MGRIDFSILHLRDELKKLITLLFVVAVLFCTSVFADDNERAGLFLFLDAGIPIQGAEGRYGSDFGRSFLDLTAQARLAGNFFCECCLVYFPEPRPNDAILYNSNGFEFSVDGVWKFAAKKKISPFVKIGLSYAWISSNNAWREIYYPAAGRETDKFLGVNAGGGIEYKLGGMLWLRLGGIFTLIPNDGEGAVASWTKFFAGLGCRF